MVAKMVATKCMKFNEYFNLSSSINGSTHEIVSYLINIHSCVQYILNMDKRFSCNKELIEYYFKSIYLFEHYFVYKAEKNYHS